MRSISEVRIGFAVLSRLRGAFGGIVAPGRRCVRRGPASVICNAKELWAIRPAHSPDWINCK